MAIYLDTTGRPTLAIAICARCSVKYPRDELRPDPNSPGLMCCPDGCLDDLDPWRLSPRPADKISLEWARPDVSLAPGPQAVPVLPFQAAVGGNHLDIIEAAPPFEGIAAAPAVSTVYQPVPWTAATFFRLGQQITPTVAIGPTAEGVLFDTYTCIVPGTSGASPPAWPGGQGKVVEDNTAWWVSSGIFMP